MKRRLLLLPVLATISALALAMGTASAHVVNGHAGTPAAGHTATPGVPVASTERPPPPPTPCGAVNKCGNHPVVRLVPGSPAARALGGAPTGARDARAASGAATNVTPDTVNGPYLIKAYTTNYAMDAEHQNIPTRVWVYPTNYSAAQLWWEACCYTFTYLNVQFTGVALYANYGGYLMCQNVSGYNYAQGTNILAWQCSNGYYLTSNEVFDINAEMYNGQGGYWAICPSYTDTAGISLCDNVAGGIASEHYVILWNLNENYQNSMWTFWTG
jgi:hypothetical protein